MEKEDANYWVDVILAVSFLLVGITGIIKLKSVMNYFGLEWQSPIIQLLSRIHDWSGIVLILFVLIHLILHYVWIIAKTKELLGIEEQEE
jgi:cytochrome b subunit of formate dehydrogenase